MGCAAEEPHKHRRGDGRGGGGVQVAQWVTKVTSPVPPVLCTGPVHTHTPHTQHTLVAHPPKCAAAAARTATGPIARATPGPMMAVPCLNSEAGPARIRTSRPQHTSTGTGGGEAASGHCACSHARSHSPTLCTPPPRGNPPRPTHTQRSPTHNDPDASPTPGVMGGGGEGFKLHSGSPGSRHPYRQLSLWSHAAGHTQSTPHPSHTPPTPLPHPSHTPTPRGTQMEHNKAACANTHHRGLPTGFGAAPRCAHHPRTAARPPTHTHTHTHSDPPPPHTHTHTDTAPAAVPRHPTHLQPDGHGRRPATGQGGQLAPPFPPRHQVAGPGGRGPRH